jgi:hypothetical protein
MPSRAAKACLGAGHERDIACVALAAFWHLPAANVHTDMTCTRNQNRLGPAAPPAIADLQATDTLCKTRTIGGAQGLGLLWCGCRQFVLRGLACETSFMATPVPANHTKAPCTPSISDRFRTSVLAVVTAAVFSRQRLATGRHSSVQILSLRAEAIIAQHSRQCDHVLFQIS